MCTLPLTVLTVCADADLDVDVLGLRASLQI